MPSHMIHYTILRNISERIEINDLERFFLGGVIVPDASNHNDGSYDIAHFLDILNEQKLKGINYALFEEKHGAEFGADSIFLGYWFHLIQDAMWYHDVVDRYVRIYPRAVRKTISTKGYRDYQKLNYLLKNAYELKEPVFEFQNIFFEGIIQCRIEETALSFQKQFCTACCSKDDLELYDWNIITDYIDRCTDFCVREYNAKLEKGERSDPIRFFVSL